MIIQWYDYVTFVIVNNKSLKAQKLIWVALDSKPDFVCW